MICEDDQATAMHPPHSDVDGVSTAPSVLACWTDARMNVEEAKGQPSSAVRDSSVLTCIGGAGSGICWWDANGSEQMTSEDRAHSDVDGVFSVPPVSARWDR